MKAVLASVVAVLLVGSTELAAQTKAPSPDAQRIDALKLSQMCADSGTKFLAKLEKDSPSTTYASETHYNRTLGRCLLYASEGQMETIYDAVEGVYLAQFWFVRPKDGDTAVGTCFTTNIKGEQVPCVNDKRLVNIAESVFDRYRLDVMNH